METNSIPAFRDYVEAYPEGEFADEAYDRMARRFEDGEPRERQRMAVERIEQVHQPSHAVV